MFHFPGVAAVRLLPPSFTWLLVGTLAGLCPSLSLQAGDLEHIVVTSRKPVDADGQTVSGFASHTEIDELLIAPTNLVELVSRLPGVDYTGQGGQFQTVSIRGLGRQRVGNYFLDIPLLSERRAGTATSFIDPAMLGSVALIRGPASTTYGAGNVAGLIRSRPASPLGVEARLGWGGSGDENAQFIGVGGDWGGVAFSRRGSDNAETPAGTPLHTEFEQYNLMVNGRRETQQASYDLVSLMAYGSDIGKSNARYPDERITLYPRERHWLSQLTRQTEGHSASLYFHYQDLETEVLRPAVRLDYVDSSSLDFGARFTTNSAGERPWDWGVEYMGRRNVDSDQWQTPAGQPEQPREQTLRAEQDEVAAFIDGRYQWDQLTVTGGLRITAERQEAEGWSRQTEQFGSGYLGASLQLDSSWRLTGELSRGVRVANLSEKFFSGTTGRGTVVGNPDLKPETADSLDLGLIRATPDTRLEFHLYHMSLDNFIERVPLGGDELSFRNLSGGEISGAEFAASWTVQPTLELRLDGHWQDGETGDGSPLQDVAPNRLSAGLGYEIGAWRVSVDYSHRFGKSSVAPGEQPVSSADLVWVMLRRELPAGLAVGVWGRNLLNEEYLISTDELSTEAEKIAVGVELSWRSGGD